LRRFFLKVIEVYQYISALTPASCRYYPTCSEYAKWQFRFNRADRAFFSTIFRILRCNQLFRGGIDYPMISYKTPSLLRLYSIENIKVKYWFVPAREKKFYVVKVLD